MDGGDILTGQRDAGTIERARPSVQRDRLRLWVSTHLPTIAFLAAYFVTTVAGNLVFASPLAGYALRVTEYSPRFLEFPQTFTFGYWALLLCPFVIAPVVAAATRRLFGRWVAAGVRSLPEFGQTFYGVLVVLCFGYVIYRFWLADVARLFTSGANMASSIEARFTIRERIGFFTFMPLQALLPFLTVYALVRWLASRQVFWGMCAIIECLLLTVLLVMTNMKWPLLLFCISLVLTILVYGKQRTYLKTAIGAALVFLAFLAISTFVFRMSPSSSTPVMGAVRSASTYAPTIVFSALNRMAVSYPYYYQVFTAEGPVCGGILAQARRHPACRPSEMIYTRMFGSNEFEHRGTAPLAVHISGYALGGWPIALLALVAGSVILGLFSAVPIDGSAMTGALVILGAVTGYHLSQIPGEGVILYEHGLLWIGLLLLANALARRATAKA